MAYSTFQPCNCLHPQIWERYKHVWEIDREDTISAFVKRKPVLKDFENELQKYNMAKSQLTTERTEYR